ncbi:MAG: hypothetical protein J6X78_02735 [Treponema sp.]|nr:hypothetical protein [Treponema sp.]
MEQTELFEKIYNESNILRETTEIANLSKLDAQLKTDIELKNLLYTPAKDLPEKYKFLVDEIYEEYENKTLYYVIKESCRRLKTTSFFSMAGDKIVGFFAYIIGEGNVIDEIKMFSFDIERNNPVLAADLIRLLNKLRESYIEIRWDAIKENPANEQYKKIIEKLNGTVKEVSGKYYHYTIPGKIN